MINIIRASIFKLLKDWTFRITMIIGVCLAALMIGLNAYLGTLNGQDMLISSVSPTQNFGLTVPINLVVFTVGEFTYGTIRNKIIAGHSKFKIYTGLFLTGLIFTFSLMIVYLGLVVGIGSIAGGFDAAKIGGPRFVGSFIAYFFVTYIFVTSLSVFFGALMRNIGGSISIAVVALVLIGLLPLIISLSSGKGFTSENAQMWINPLYMIGLYGSASSIIKALSEVIPGIQDAIFLQSNQMIAAGIITPLYWAVVFFAGGVFLFKRRDIK